MINICITSMYINTNTNNILHSQNQKCKSCFTLICLQDDLNVTKKIHLLVELRLFSTFLNVSQNFSRHMQKVYYNSTNDSKVSNVPNRQQTINPQSLSFQLWWKTSFSLLIHCHAITIHIYLQKQHEILHWISLSHYAHTDPTILQIPV